MIGVSQMEKPPIDVGIEFDDGRELVLSLPTYSPGFIEAMLQHAGGKISDDAFYDAVVSEFGFAPPVSGTRHIKDINLGTAVEDARLIFIGDLLRKVTERLFADGADFASMWADFRVDGAAAVLGRAMGTDADEFFERFGTAMTVADIDEYLDNVEAIAVAGRATRQMDEANAKVQDSVDNEPTEPAGEEPQTEEADESEELVDEEPAEPENEESQDEEGNESEEPADEEPQIEEDDKPEEPADDESVKPAGEESQTEEADKADDESSEEPADDRPGDATEEQSDGDDPDQPVDATEEQPSDEGPVVDESDKYDEDGFIRDGYGDDLYAAGLNAGNTSETRAVEGAEGVSDEELADGIDVGRHTYSTVDRDNSEPSVGHISERGSAVSHSDHDSFTDRIIGKRDSLTGVYNEESDTTVEKYMTKNVDPILGGIFGKREE